MITANQDVFLAQQVQLGVEHLSGHAPLSPLRPYNSRAWAGALAAWRAISSASPASTAAKAA